MVKRLGKHNAWRQVLLGAMCPSLMCPSLMCPSLMCPSLMCLCLLASTGEADEDDWPQFRGPTGQGIAEEAKPPLVWSRTKNVAWKTSVPGCGWSSPIAYQGSLDVTTRLNELNG